MVRVHCRFIKLFIFDDNRNRGGRALPLLVPWRLAFHNFLSPSTWAAFHLHRALFSMFRICHRLTIRYEYSPRQHCPFGSIMMSCKPAPETDPLCVNPRRIWRPSIAAHYNIIVACPINARTRWPPRAPDRTPHALHRAAARSLSERERGLAKYRLSIGASCDARLRVEGGPRLCRKRVSFTGHCTGGRVDRLHHASPRCLQLRDKRSCAMERTTTLNLPRLASWQKIASVWVQVAYNLSRPLPHSNCDVCVSFVRETEPSSNTSRSLLLHHAFLESTISFSFFFSSLTSISGSFQAYCQTDWQPWLLSHECLSFLACWWLSFGKMWSPFPAELRVVRAATEHLNIEGRPSQQVTEAIRSLTICVADILPVTFTRVSQWHRLSLGVHV